MPNRIIKESVCTSETIDKMSWFEECFFHRLWTACDDYGRMDARPAILKSKLFPLKDRLSLKDIENALHKLADIGCVRLYECDSKPYLYLPAWEVHQRIRNKRSKYPEPGGLGSMQAFDNNCCQMTADVSNCCRNPIQSESESESESNTCPEQAPLASVPEEPPVILFTLNDGTEYPVSQGQCREWEGLYPAVDVMQQLRSMKGWLDANPKRRKTKNGITRFVNGWLAKEQNRGGTPGYSPPEPEKDSTPYGTGEMLPDTQRVHLPENATLDDVLALIP